MLQADDLSEPNEFLEHLSLSISHFGDMSLACLCYAFSSQSILSTIHQIEADDRTESAKIANRKVLFSTKITSNRSHL